MSTTKEFREEALKLADTIGIPNAAKELRITTSKLYGWRSAAKKKISVSRAYNRECASEGNGKRIEGNAK